MAENQNRLQNFPQFLREQVGYEWCDQMLGLLTKFNESGGSLLGKLDNWENLNDEKKVNFIVALIGAMDRLYCSKYPDNYKVSVVNPTQRKKIVNEFKLILKQRKSLS